MIISKRKSDKNPQPAQDYYITAEKEAELRTNLQKLIKTIKPRLIDEVSLHAKNGDFSENAAYQIAKSKLRGVNNRILILQDQLKNAVIIEKKPSDGIIRIGSQVIIKTNGQQFNYQILGSQETNPSAGKISHLSPIGSALLGHQTGDEIEITINDIKNKYKIIKVN